MRVFISSVIKGFETERQAAARGARTLRHEVRLAEDFAASPDTPQATCLEGVRWAEVVVLLLGERYGARQPSGLSATHEEYREARDRCEVLAFVKRDVQREPAQQTFIAEVQDYVGGVFTSAFSSPQELGETVTHALYELALRKQAGAPNDSEILQRAQARLGHELSQEGFSLTLVVASGPLQAVLRPSQMENPKLSDDLSQQALFGRHRLFDRAAATETRLIGDTLLLKQSHAELFLDSLGTVRISRSFPRLHGFTTPMPAIIEEDVRDYLEDGLAAAGEIVERIDSEHRLTRVVPVAQLEHAHQPWRTRAEQAANPNTATIPLMAHPHSQAHLSPPGRHRSALAHDRDELAEDLLVLLRRGVRG